MNQRLSITDFLGLRRNTVLLLVALVLAGTGERLWLGFAPKYLETLGAGVLVIGLFDALQTFLGAVYAYPGGWLTDRWGQRRSLLLFNALTLAGYVLVLVWQHWLALVVGAFLFLAWLAHHALRLGTGRVLRTARLHRVQCGHGGLSMVHGGASDGGYGQHHEVRRELSRRGEDVQPTAARTVGQ